MHWWQILESVGPLVLQFTPLAPIAPLVVAGIKAANALPGVSGAQKKQIVQGIVQLGAQATDVATGKPLLDPAVVGDLSGSIIDSVVGITNAVHAAHQAATPSVPPAPAPQA